MKLFKYIKKTDWLMLALIIFNLATLNYDDINTWEAVLLGCIATWIVFLFVRLYILYRKDQ